MNLEITKKPNPMFKKRKKLRISMDVGLASVWVENA